jgi:hypothetical protein
MIANQNEGEPNLTVSANNCIDASDCGKKKWPELINIPKVFLDKERCTVNCYCYR